jgi:septal ring factor EnvC (AmiA/AmiB activator)
MKTTETQIALHEQRLNTLEAAYPRFESKIDQILEKLSTTVVTKTEYEKDVKAQKEVNRVVEEELETIKSTMVTISQMDAYNRSQFWQKLVTYVGGIGSAVLIAIVMYEVSKLIEK